MANVVVFFNMCKKQNCRIFSSHSGTANLSINQTKLYEADFIFYYFSFYYSTRH